MLYSSWEMFNIPWVYTHSLVNISTMSRVGSHEGPVYARRLTENIHHMLIFIRRKAFCTHEGFMNISTMCFVCSHEGIVYARRLNEHLRNVLRLFARRNFVR